MLTLMLAQVLIGLFVSDVDGIESGPLSHLVSFETSRTLAEIHEIVFNVILGLIALHIAAILFYLLAKRDNLVVAMLTGKRRNGENDGDDAGARVASHSGYCAGRQCRLVDRKLRPGAVDRSTAVAPAAQALFN